jgi:hypothetical protein
MVDDGIDLLCDLVGVCLCSTRCACDEVKGFAYGSLSE